jgi:DNA-directed RNA polymerase subunit RPC12/RpoP
MKTRVDIACPHCGWKPDGEEYWQCDGCGQPFSMFGDAGRCPSCYHVHEHTQCIDHAGGCGSVAPHLDWYIGLDEGLREINVERDR